MGPKKCDSTEESLLRVERCSFLGAPRKPGGEAGEEPEETQAYWNIDGSRDLSYSWTGFTEFTLLEEKPPEGYMWSGWTLPRKQLTSRPDHLMARTLGEKWERMPS